jgi:hypothetical protein
MVILMIKIRRVTILFLSLILAGFLPTAAGADSKTGISPGPVSLQPAPSKTTKVVTGENRTGVMKKKRILPLSKNPVFYENIAGYRSFVNPMADSNPGNTVRPMDNRFYNQLNADLSDSFSGRPKPPTSEEKFWGTVLGTTSTVLGGVAAAQCLGIISDGKDKNKKKK